MERDDFLGWLVTSGAPGPFDTGGQDPSYVDYTLIPDKPKAETFSLWALLPFGVMAVFLFFLLLPKKRKA